MFQRVVRKKLEGAAELKSPKGDVRRRIKSSPPRNRAGERDPCSEREGSSRAASKAAKPNVPEGDELGSERAKRRI